MNKHYNNTMIHLILKYNSNYSLLFTCHEQILLCHKWPMILYQTAVYLLHLQESLSTQVSSLFPGKKITNIYSGKRGGTSSRLEITASDMKFSDT
jgi:hypothetical protein